MNIIPADESSFFIWFFDHYTRWSLKRRFKQVWVKQEYQPAPQSKTIYFLNHNLWWDGLIPLYLNRNFLHQNARALMEDKQMRQYTFFSKIGAFSIDLDNPKSSLSSLRYALESMKRDNASLFIYPEGKITPASNSEPDFKQGLAWLYTNCKDADFVPIAIYSHFLRSSKPELYLSIGKSVNHNNSLGRNILTELFQRDIHQNLLSLREVAGFTDEGFKPQF
ncbi:MAG: 1-acyl-sn-glycerol-3-phosphate acyltransferase [Gracilimonas sp.]|uniref:lysophospholipid acyltransferase family protein n=1 Tax=Gracilimonas sp. TaxID=1974203 RepID=UPI0019BB1AAA|nr:lysophospholipid acyltransferase family protein [Gracilimonas sp.]MBD3615571.1 1-acyl-sn-glycerol-3-phosphate acyltransferase [Gracilimonas sp.]